MINQIENIESEEGLVSVIIPTYNRETTLKRAILSIIRQTYTNWELIIVDDGSTDGTEELVRNFISEKIHYIKFEVNQGVSKARNRGIRHAKGEYVAFLDSDDEWVVDKLEMQLKVMKQKGTKVVYCRFSRLFEDGESYIVPANHQIKYLEGDLFYQLLVNNFIGTPTMVIAKDVLEEIGGFDENLQNLEDYELILRVAKDFYIAFVDEVLVHTYAQKDSINVNLFYVFNSQKYLLELYREEYQNMGIYEEKLAETLAIGEMAKNMKINELTQKLENVSRKVNS